MRFNTITPDFSLQKMMQNPRIKPLAKAIFCAAVPVLCWNLVPPEAAALSSLIALCLCLWASALVPEAWTALLFFLVVSMFSLAPQSVAFSGFSSPTFWLFLSGLVLSAAVSHTGLSVPLQHLLYRAMGASYVRTIAACVVLGVGLAFILPSGIVRMIVFLPIVSSLAANLGLSETDRERTGMMIAASFGTLLPAFAILPANTPNLILAGAAHTAHGIDISYFEYLLLHFPVLGLLKAGLIILLVLKLYPSRTQPASISNQERAPLSSPAKRLAVLLFVTLGLWMTDGFHGISAAWIGLSAALVCLLPAAGLVSPKCLKSEIGVGGLLFLAGLLGVGAVLSSSSLGALLGETLFSFNSDQSAFVNTVWLAGKALLIGSMTNMVTVPAVLAPMADVIAGQSELSMRTVLMAQVLAFSTPLLPYQVPPIIIAIGIGRIPLSEVTRFCLILFCLTIIILLPLDLLWWSLLGKI